MEVEGGGGAAQGLLAAQEQRPVYKVYRQVGTGLGL